MKVTRSTKRKGMTGGKPRKKKPSVAAAKLRSWTAFARYIRKRDPHCVTCGAPTTEAGHYQHNSDKANKVQSGNALWFDERNVNGQCARCNRWMSGNLTAYALYLTGKHGIGVLDALNQLYHQRKFWPVDELNEIAERYAKLWRG